MLILLAFHQHILMTIKAISIEITRQKTMVSVVTKGGSLLPRKLYMRTRVKFVCLRVNEKVNREVQLLRYLLFTRQ